MVRISCTLCSAKQGLVIMVATLKVRTVKPQLSASAYWISTVELQLGQREEAEAELLALAAHKDASIQFCMEAFSGMIEANSGTESLKAAADLVLDRLQKETIVPVKIIEAILGQTKEVLFLVFWHSNWCRD